MIEMIIQLLWLEYLECRFCSNTSIMAMKYLHNYADWWKMGKNVTGHDLYVVLEVNAE